MASFAVVVGLANDYDACLLPVFAFGLVSLVLPATRRASLVAAASVVVAGKLLKSQ
jgi:hypothetical protein